MCNNRRVAHLVWGGVSYSFCLYVTALGSDNKNPNIHEWPKLYALQRTITFGETENYRLKCFSAGVGDMLNYMEYRYDVDFTKYFKIFFDIRFLPP